MNKIKNYIKNLGFRKKILYISLGISLIPLLLLGSYSYSQSRRLLIEREEIVLKESLDQEIRNLDYKMDSYLAAMKLIIWNDNIRSSLAKTYDNNYDMYKTYRDVIDPLFLTISSLHSTINTVTIFTDNPIYPHGDVLLPLSQITESSRFNTAYNHTIPFFTLSEDGQTLYLICQMYNKQSPYTNIIQMSIDSKSLFHSMTKLFDDSYGIVVFNQNQDIIWHYANISESEQEDIEIISKLKSCNNNEIEIEDYVVKQASLSSATWSAYLYRPVKTVYALVDQLAIAILLIILFCFTLVMIFCTLLSKVVVRPLEALAQNMKLIEKGNLSITVSYNSTDEIGSLIHAFKKMIERLKHLINEVLQSKITQQEYEMKALQAQINPHFLYNSLSLINAKAILSDQEEISQMAQLLSTFYRTTLNKGNSFTTVKDEIQNTMAYAQIQKIMHSNNFDIIYDIDESIYPYMIPNLLLQPLVENAIIHGIDHKEIPDKGILTISCYQEENALVFKVMDNGCGMTEEQCNNILTSKSTGYGVQNVHHRVILYYGTEYGLKYTSTKGLGTCVTLKLGKSCNKANI